MHYLIWLAILATSLGASAQECESVVALSKVVSTVVSNRDSVEQHAANFCNEYSRSSGRSSSSSFGASFKFLAASFGSNSASVDEVASKYCSASNSSSATKDAYKQYIESISPNAYSAYEQCLRMTKQDLRFSVNLASVLPAQFSMSVAFTSSVSGSQAAKLAYSASDGISCKWGTSSEKTLSMPSGSSALLDCSRTDQTKRGYVMVVRSDATSSDPLTLPWQAYNREGVPVDTLAELQQSIRNMQMSVAELRSSVALDCAMETAVSGTTSYSVAEAKIPDARRQDYRVTGGSCKTGIGTSGHNAILLESRRTDDGYGWICKSGDQANIPTPVQTTASVIYCRSSAAR